MKLLDLMQIARSMTASDLHLITGISPAMRINGEIILMNRPPMDAGELRRMVDEILNDDQKQHLQKNWELCFSLFDADRARARVTIYFHAGNTEVSVRLCSFNIPDSFTLGLPSIMDDLARKPNGLILIAGATGAGKTTTLNYMVDLINRERRCKIVMIEDPVEYVHRPQKALIVQQEVHTDTHSFSRALIHVLRQNPDVIVICEMRELEAIATALTAAETGHLVIATLHTPNTMQTVERITAVFPGDQQKQITLQLANSLQAVITQDLIPRADKKGRALAYEVMVANAAVRNTIRENNLHQLFNLVETGRKDGMNTMDQCLQDLYQRAVITYDAALSRARSIDRFVKQQPGGSAAPVRESVAQSFIRRLTPGS